MWDDRVREKKKKEVRHQWREGKRVGVARRRTEIEGLHGSPEERSIVHALGDERPFLLQLFLDRIERVLLRHRQVPKTAGQRHVIRVGYAWWKCRCACGCWCGGHGQYVCVCVVCVRVRWYRERSGACVIFTALFVSLRSSTIFAG